MRRRRPRGRAPGRRRRHRQTRARTPRHVARHGRQLLRPRNDGSPQEVRRVRGAWVVRPQRHGRREPRGGYHARVLRQRQRPGRRGVRPTRVDPRARERLPRHRVLARVTVHQSGDSALL